MPDQAPEDPMLFCNIAWMKKYKGESAKDDPVGGGKDPVKEEHLNYRAFDGQMYGYVAATHGTNTRTIRLERLGAEANAESVPNVTVVWTATRPQERGSGRCVVGWYSNATVFRELQEHPDRGLYNVKAAANDCVLIKPSQRRLDIETGKKGRPGHSPVWFPSETNRTYGAKARSQVSRLLCQQFDRDKLNIPTAAELSKGVQLDAPPPGVRKPISQNRMVTVWGRDPKVRDYVLARAGGKCELCGAPAPFNLANGALFLEVHHIRQLASAGPDTTSNAVALCPNCHREAHLGARKNTISKKLRNFLRKTRQ